MDSIKPEWIKRGYIKPEQLLKYQDFSDAELFKLLISRDAVQRTISATILGVRKSENSVKPLCEALKKEKALYCKIAISEALENIGISALNPLIDLLGKIGKNQYNSLPDKPFEKWNYPLPRDIAARTIIRIRETALNPILKSISNLDIKQLSEAIDAIGFISFYSKNVSAFDQMIDLLRKYTNHDLIVWKLIACLQSFPNPEGEEILGQYLLNHNIPAIRWEAARSLGQICSKVSESLILGLNDKDGYVCKACKDSIDRILIRSKSDM